MKLKKGILFLLPSIIGVLLFVLLPFLDVINRSFQTAVTKQYVGLDNYKMIMTNEAFILAVKNTLRFTIICLPLLIGISLFLAILLSKLEHLSLLKSMYLIPLAIPAATIVLLWKMVFSKQGFLNQLMGNSTIDYMATQASFWVLVFSYVWKNVGYTIVLWLAGILSISTDILEAARVDGAGERQCFLKIVLPNLKGSLYTITILSFLNSFKVYREAYLVAGSYPHESMYLLQHLFNNWFVHLDLDKMAAAAVCIGLVMFIGIGLLQMLWEKQ